MDAVLPPLRLTGALALRDDALQQRSLAIQDGRFTTGPLPAVDMTGYYLLPGIVDIAARPAGASARALPQRMADLDRQTARDGVTSRCLAIDWSWDRLFRPDRAERRVRDVADHRAQSLTDLRVHLVADRTMVGEEAALLALAESAPVAAVSFAAGTEDAADLRATDPEGFARAAWARGLTPEALGDAIDTALMRKRDVPRHLCRLAEAFDRLGIVYGSTGDRSAETREHYSMIGARICHAPGTAQVAAASHAVGDPVVLDAGDLIAPGVAASRAAALVRSGLCDALTSAGDSAAPVAAAFHLAERRVLPFAAAWKLVSSGPAEILRLPDRGTIAPGKRADLAIVNAATKTVEATICGGRLAFATGTAAARLARVAPALRHAAE